MESGPLLDVAGIALWEAAATGAEPISGKSAPAARVAALPMRTRRRDRSNRSSLRCCSDMAGDPLAVGFSTQTGMMLGDVSAATATNLRCVRDRRLNFRAARHGRCRPGRVFAPWRRGAATAARGFPDRRRSCRAVLAKLFQRARAIVLDGRLTRR